MDEIETDVKTLLECLKCHQNNSKALCHTLITLSSLFSNNEEAKDIFREENGLQYVLKLMISATNPQLQHSIMFCLACSVDKNVLSQTILTKKEIFDYLHHILQDNNRKTEKIKQTAIFLLLCIVASNGVGQKLARESQCLNDLIKLFRELLEDVKRLKTQDNISLWCSLNSAISMCVNNPQNERNQRECCILLPLSLQFISGHDDPANIRSLLALIGLTVANNACNQDRVRKCGGINIITSRIRDWMQLIESDCDYLSLAVNGFSTIDSCISDNERNCLEFIEENGVELLFCLLKVKELDTTEILQIVLTLGHTLDHMSDGKFNLKKDHIDQLVQLLTGTHDEELMKAIKYVLQLKIGRSNTTEQNQSSESHSDPNNLILKKITELSHKLDSMDTEIKSRKSETIDVENWINKNNNRCNDSFNKSVLSLQKNDVNNKANWKTCGPNSPNNINTDIQNQQNIEEIDIFSRFTNFLRSSFTQSHGNLIQNQESSHSFQHSTPSKQTHKSPEVHGLQHTRDNMSSQKNLIQLLNQKQNSSTEQSFNRSMTRPTNPVINQNLDRFPTPCDWPSNINDTTHQGVADITSFNYRNNSTALAAICQSHNCGHTETHTDSATMCQSQDCGHTHSHTDSATKFHQEAVNVHPFIPNSFKHRPLDKIHREINLEQSAIPCCHSTPKDDKHESQTAEQSFQNTKCLHQTSFKAPTQSPIYGDPDANSSLPPAYNISDINQSTNRILNGASNKPIIGLNYKQKSSPCPVQLQKMCCRHAIRSMSETRCTKNTYQTSSNHTQHSHQEFPNLSQSGIQSSDHRQACPISDSHQNVFKPIRAPHIPNVTCEHNYNHNCNIEPKLKENIYNCQSERDTASSNQTTQTDIFQLSDKSQQNASDSIPAKDVSIDVQNDTDDNDYGKPSDEFSLVDLFDLPKSNTMTKTRKYCVDEKHVSENRIQTGNKHSLIQNRSSNNSTIIKSKDSLSNNLTESHTSLDLLKAINDAGAIDEEVSEVFTKPKAPALRRRIRHAPSLGSTPIASNTIGHQNTLWQGNNMESHLNNLHVTLKPSTYALSCVSSPGPSITGAKTRDERSRVCPSPALSEFDQLLMQQAKSDRQLSAIREQVVQTGKDSPTSNYNHSLSSSNQDSLMQSLDDSMQDSDGQFTDEDDNLSLYNREPKGNTNCPGCKNLDDGTIVNSRTFNIIMESSLYSCSFHRQVRELERQFIQDVKLDQDKSIPRNLTPNYNRKIPDSRNTTKADVYEFPSSSSNSHKNSHKKVSPPRTHETEVRVGTHVAAQERRKRIPYTQAEIANLLDGVETIGRRWNQILLTYKFHPIRTSVDLQEKYKRMMKIKPSNRRQPKPFSMCEERRLRRGIKVLGYNWTGILHSYKFSQSRTAEDLRNKWRNMNKIK